MALVLSARRERVTSDGRRAVEYNLAFDDGTAAEVTLDELGLNVVDEVWVKLPTAESIAVTIDNVGDGDVTLEAGDADEVLALFIGH